MGEAFLVRLCRGVVAEDLHDEVLLCDTDRAVVHRVPTADAPWAADLALGVAVEVGDDLLARRLIDAGLVEHVGTSRRQIITRAAGAAAVAGAASIALPKVAAAASGPPVPPPSSTSTTTTPTTTTTIPPTPPSQPNAGMFTDENTGLSDNLGMQWRTSAAGVAFSYSVTIEDVIEASGTVSAAEALTGVVVAGVFAGRAGGLPVTVTMTATESPYTGEVYSTSFTTVDGFVDVSASGAALSGGWVTPEALYVQFNWSATGPGVNASGTSLFDALNGSWYMDSTIAGWDVGETITVRFTALEPDPPGGVTPQIWQTYRTRTS